MLTGWLKNYFKINENCSNFSKWLISLATHPDVLRIQNCMGTISAMVICMKCELLPKSLLLHNELDWNNGWKQLKSRQHISAFFLILDRLDFWLHTLKEFLYYCYDEESCCWTVLKLTLNSQVKPQKVWNSQKLGGGARRGKRMFLMYNILLQQIQNCKIWYNLELNNWTIW